MYLSPAGHASYAPPGERGDLSAPSPASPPPSPCCPPLLLPRKKLSSGEEALPPCCLSARLRRAAPPPRGVVVLPRRRRRSLELGLAMAAAAAAAAATAVATTFVEVGLPGGRQGVCLLRSSEAERVNKGGSRTKKIDGKPIEKQLGWREIFDSLIAREAGEQHALAACPKPFHQARGEGVETSKNLNQVFFMISTIPTGMN